MANAILGKTDSIKTRNDLSFTGREANDQGFIINWAPVRVPSQLNQWNIEHRIGEAMIEELRELHTNDERAAYDAIRFAVNASTWRVCSYGAESGFAAGIAALAVVGMRALKSGAEPYDSSSQKSGAVRHA